ncbi:MAG: Phosphoglycolate phosphatase [Alphaproteobacteria bacterium MarineAlpha8_Bin1]|nr:MAG: Phosphoglycolate phosphatase [Alphaproteobacteria bacterium MarineAlpha8_Bin1]
MKKKIDSIIFDLDGTIIDSGPDLLDSLNFVLKKKKLPSISNKVIGNLVGGGASAMIKKGYEYIGKKIDDREVKELVEVFLEYYFQNCSKKTTIYDGIQDFIIEMKKKNFKIGLCTNKKQYLTEKILNDFKINKYFDAIVGSSIDIKLKPDTEMLELCLNKLNSIPQNSVMVGDSENDVIPANKLNMTSIFVTYGYGNLKEKIRPDFTINKINLLKDFLVI